MKQFEVRWDDNEMAWYVVERGQGGWPIHGKFYIYHDEAEFMAEALETWLRTGGTGGYPRIEFVDELAA